MSDLKRPLGIDVLTAARQRIADVFDHFPRVVVSFSAGKDSTVLTHLVADEARKRARTFALLLIDLEAQYKLTISHAERVFADYADCSEPYWVSLPLHLRNAVSAYEPHWVCWEPDRKEDWVREPPSIAITDQGHFPFFRPAMEFEEFVAEFGHWYGDGQLTACLVGIRADESLNRFRAVFGDHSRFQERKWTTYKNKATYNAYPIYDWRTADVWTYHAKHKGRPYNPLYDLMHKAGLSIHQQRICQPYGDDQRKGLWLYHLIEPETWGRVVARVNGANSGALYASDRGNITGVAGVTLPPGHTWQSFAMLILGSLPPATAEHYRDKIAVFLKWYQGRGFPHGIPDEAPPALEASKKVPSWRRIVKMLLRNDYWAKGLSFTQQKSTAYEQYRKVMKSRRAKWGLI